MKRQGTRRATSEQPLPRRPPCCRKDTNDLQVLFFFLELSSFQPHHNLHCSLHYGTRLACGSSAPVFRVGLLGSHQGARQCAGNTSWQRLQKGRDGCRHPVEGRQLPLTCPQRRQETLLPQKPVAERLVPLTLAAAWAREGTRPPTRRHQETTSLLHHALTAASQPSPHSHRGQEGHAPPDVRPDPSTCC